MSTEESTTAETTVSDYEVSQYFPRPESGTDVPAGEYGDLRSEYGFIRAWTKANPERFRGLQRSLNQAGMGTTFDRYLVRCVRYAGLGTAAGLLVGLVVAAVLVTGGMLTGLQSPVAVEGTIADLLRANKVLLGASLLTLLLGLAGGVVAFVGTYYRPRYVVGHRRRSIEFMLPHAITYMYALSHGGMNLVEVVDRLADSEDAYGEVALEFDAIRRDVDLFGSDLLSALGNRRNLTPSSGLERFLDDLVSVLDTGGDVTTFLEDSTETYLEEADEEQEDFLNTVAVFSEIYVAAFVAAPLFLVVILMVISFVGGSTLGPMHILIYLGFPVGMGLFLATITALSSAYTFPKTTLAVEELALEHDVDATSIADDERFQHYRRGERRATVGRLLRTPFRLVREQPLWSLAITAPVALVYLAVVLLTGVASPADMFGDPVSTTSMLAVYPFLLLVVPLALFYELKRGRENAILERFPASLNILSSANKMGIPFPDALNLLSRYSSGILGREFRVTRNDLLWSGDINRSLLSMANRLNVSQLSRTMKLIADGLQSSGDLSRVLAIAAQDARDQQRILRRRRREMSTYIAVVIIGFLVYLMVIVFLDIGYLQPIEDIAAETADDTLDSPITLTDVPTETYRMLLFHSVLIQAVGTGLIAGKLTDNSVMSGLKYSIGLVALTLLVFTVIH